MGNQLSGQSREMVRSLWLLLCFVGVGVAVPVLNARPCNDGADCPSQWQCVYGECLPRTVARPEVICPAIHCNETIGCPNGWICLTNWDAGNINGTKCCPRAHAKADVELTTTKCSTTDCRTWADFCDNWDDEQK